MLLLLSEKLFDADSGFAETGGTIGMGEEEIDHLNVVGFSIGFRRDPEGSMRMQIDFISHEPADTTHRKEQPRRLGLGARRRIRLKSWLFGRSLRRH
jgi:hypothetical protein